MLPETDLSIRFYPIDKKEELVSADGLAQAFPVGELLVDFIECDIVQLNNIYNSDVTIEQPLSNVSYSSGMEKLDRFKEKIDQAHPYFKCLWGKIDNIQMEYTQYKNDISRGNNRSDKEHIAKLNEIYMKIMGVKNNFSPHGQFLNLIRMYRNAVEKCLDLDTEGKKQDFKVRALDFGTNIDPYFFNQNLKVRYDPELKEIYDIESVSNACFIEFVMMIRSNIGVRKCRHCNRYFVPQNRTDNLYCHRIAGNQTKSCFQIAATSKYSKKVSENPILSIYQRAYKKMNARVRHKKMSRQEFYTWSENARNIRDKALNNEISISDFEEWLKESDNDGINTATKRK